MSHRTADGQNTDLVLCFQSAKGASYGSEVNVKKISWLMTLFLDFFSSGVGMKPIHYFAWCLQSKCGIEIDQ